MAIQSQDLNFKILASVIGGQAIDDLRKKVDGIGSSAKTLESGFALAGKALKALGIAFAAKEIIGFGKSLIDAADNMRDLSQRSGVSVDTLSRFQLVADQTGTNMTELAGGMKKLNVAIAQASAGNDAAVFKFQKLGIAVKDANGSTRGAGDVLVDLSKKFSQFKEGPEKAAAAVALFGKQGDALIPFLNDLSRSTENQPLFSQDFANRADQFNDSLAEIKNDGLRGMYSALGPLMPALQEVVNSFKGMTSEGSTLQPIMIALGEAIRILTAGFHALLLPILTVADAIVTLTVEALDRSITRLKQFGTLIGGVAASLAAVAEGNFSGAKNALSGTFSDMDKQETDFLQRRDQRLSGFGDRLVKRAESTAKRLEELSKGSYIGGLLDGKTFEQIEKETAARTKPATNSGTSNAPNISDPSGGSKLAGELAKARALREAGLQQVEVERLKADSYLYSSLQFERMVETQKAEIDIVKATKDMTVQGAAAYRDSANAVLEAKLALLEYQDAQKQSFGVGALQGLHEYAEQARNVAGQMKDAVTNAFKGMEDSLVQFAKTGKLDFKSLADSIITDLIRIAIRSAVLGPISSAIGGAFSGGFGGAGYGSAGGGAASGVAYAANGGIMTGKGMAKLTRYSRGGIANSPQLAMFGEGSTPEAYVPLPDGRRIPVAMKGNQGGGGTSVVVNVNMQTGQSDTSSKGDNQQNGEALGNAISARVREELLKQSRPGGLLTRAG